MKSLCSLRGQLLRRPHAARLLSARSRSGIATPGRMLCVTVHTLGSGAHVPVTRRLSAVQLSALQTAMQRRGFASAPVGF